jgi:hypothetical protein
MKITLDKLHLILLLLFSCSEIGLLFHSLTEAFVFVLLKKCHTQYQYFNSNIFGSIEAFHLLLAFQNKNINRV